jgi:ribosomal protein L18
VSWVVEGAGQLHVSGLLTASGALNLSSGGSIVAGPSSKMASMGKLTLTGLNITMAEGSSAESEDDMEITAAGSAELSTLQASNVAISAGGAVAQAANSGITAGTLAVSSQGQQRLDGANQVGSFTAANSGAGGITLHNTVDLVIGGLTQASGGDIDLVNAGDLEIAGDITTTGRVALEAEGRVVEKAEGKITAASLTVSSTGGQRFLGDNRVQSFEAQNLGGDIELNNSSAELKVMGIVQADGGNIVISNQDGGIAINGLVRTEDSISLISQGSITQEAGGRFADAASLNTHSVGGQELLGDNTVQRFSAVNAGGGRVALRNTASILEVDGISQAEGGDIELANAGDVEITGDIATTGRVRLEAGGRITEEAAGRIAAAGLETASIGGQRFLGDNRVQSFEAQNLGGDIELNNSSAELKVMGIVQAYGGNIVISNQDGGIAINGLVRTEDSISLISQGSITQEADGRFADAASLNTHSVGGQELLGDNTVQRFSAVNAGGGRVALRNTASILEVDGVSQAEGGDIELANAGDVEITGDIATTGRVRLEAGGRITEEAAGRIAAAGLETASIGGQRLPGDNRVQSFEAQNLGGDIELNSSGAELEVMGILQADGGNIVLSNQDGGIAINGLVRTEDSISLISQGSITQEADGRFADAASLNTHSVGGQELLGDNTVQRFSAVNAGGGKILLNNLAAEGLEIISILQTEGGDIGISSMGDVRITEYLRSTSGDIDITAAGAIGSVHGDVAVLGRNISLDAQEGGIGTRDARMVVTASGRTNLLAERDIYLEERDSDLDSDFIISRQGSVDLLVPAGRVRVKELRAARSILIDTSSDLELGRATASRLGLRLSGIGAQVKMADALVSEGVTIEADRIELANLVHTGAEPLRLSIGGGSKKMADDLTIRGRSGVGMVFDRLESDQALIDVDTENLGITWAFIGTRAHVRNRYHSVVADNVNKQLFSADVQLYPENKPFYLILGAERLMMTNAWVVNYDDDYIVNQFATENSFVRITGKMPQIVGFGARSAFGLPGSALEDNDGLITGGIDVSYSFLNAPQLTASDEADYDEESALQ